MAEVIKYGVIRDEAFFDYLENHRESIVSLDPTALAHVVARSCEIKAQAVGCDERETGVRAILNFGHTVGHAIETSQNYTMRHGEAVAIGMVYASRLAQETGLCGPTLTGRVENIIRAYGLPINLAALRRKPSVIELMDLMQIDKKAEAGKSEVCAAEKNRRGRHH